MALQDKIITGRDNVVSILFVGIDLTMFSSIEVAYGADVRNSINNASSVVVVSGTELNLNFNDTAETPPSWGAYWRITGFSAAFTNGLDLTNEGLKNLPASPKY